MRYAIVAYATGGVRANWFRTTGFFSSDELHLRTEYGEPTYRLTSNDTALGTFQGISGPLSAILKRIRD